jgi:hypothetical protein
MPVFIQYTRSGALYVVYPDSDGNIKNKFLPRVRIASIFDYFTCGSWDQTYRRPVEPPCIDPRPNPTYDWTLGEGVTDGEIAARHMQGEMLKTRAHFEQGPTFVVGGSALYRTPYSNALDRLSILPPLATDQWLYIKKFFDVATLEMMDADLAMPDATYCKAVEVLHFQYISGREPPGANFLKEPRMQGIVAVSTLLRKAEMHRALHASLELTPRMLGLLKEINTVVRCIASWAQVAPEVQQKHLEDLAGLLNTALRSVVELFTGTPAVKMEVLTDEPFPPPPSRSSSPARDPRQALTRLGPAFTRQPSAAVGVFSPPQSPPHSPPHTPASATYGGEENESAKGMCDGFAKGLCEHLESMSTPEEGIPAHVQTRADDVRREGDDVMVAHCLEQVLSLVEAIAAEE